jgi:phosphonate transport system permease protein
MKHPQARQFCISCLIKTMILIAIVFSSFVYLSFNPWSLFTQESFLQIIRYFQQFFPPDTSPIFLKKILYATLETIAISALATLLAACLGFAIAPLAAGQYAKRITRFLLNFLRSIPELIFAVILVLAVGLGPFAGTLALMLHTTGVLGRLFGETLENHPNTSNQALVLNGSNVVQAFFYGTLPGVTAQYISYTLYRWEINIRMATILGFVGAGGLGQILYYELSLLHEPQASSIIIAMLLLVVIVDLMSDKLRKMQMHNKG